MRGWFSTAAYRSLATIPFLISDGVGSTTLYDAPEHLQETPHDADTFRIHAALGLGLGQE